MVDPEEVGKKYYVWIKWAAIAVGCALSYELAFMAVEGLVAWAAFGVGAFLIYNFAPVFAAWVANKKIQALVAIVEANPIETMQNLYIEKSLELRAAENNITDFDTEFRNVSSLVEDLKKTDPEEAKQYIEMRDQMKAGLDGLRGEQSAATEELESFKTQIDKARRIWKVSCALNKALEKSASAQAEVFGEIKEQVAFDTVRTNLNRAFANLNTAVERRKTTGGLKAPKELPPAVEAEVIDISSKRTLKLVK